MLSTARSGSLARRRGGIRGGALALALAAVAAFAGCDVSENADLERGRSLFQGQCGTCHALAEAGTNAQVGPDLDASFAQARADGMDNDTIEGVVQAQIANPREIDEGDPDYDRVFMPADLVTGQDAEDVATYVASVAGIPGIEPPPLGKPKAVFQDLCGSCHTLSAAGTAGPVGPVLDDVLSGQSAQQIMESIRQPDAQISPGFDPGIMQAFTETQIPDQNMRDLVKYLINAVGGSTGGSGQ
ncbi:MAG: c-type cytochrome [Solirubrobacterales bacterium]